MENLKAPKWLDEIAKQEWERVLPVLQEKGLFTSAKLGTLEAYCKCYSRWRQAEEFMDKAKNTVFKKDTSYIQQLPHISISKQYAGMMRAFLYELGLDPKREARKVK